ncbi:thiamine pyrophosphokinase [Apodospora peruviana]|uniref:Thiamine pyrophosphokinase n=1 Tax=Apodospora peruviana TaxID=516989 RepID=A0AAE0HSN1_9PEZI|nr:thiamine pyrophosphokinase [Apodospora peruviana]
MDIRDLVSDSADAIEWDPAALVRNSRQQALQAEPRPERDEKAGFALIVLNQPLALYHMGLIKELWKNAFIRVAADGGANQLYDVAGEHGDECFDDLRIIIGDLDSLRDDVRSYFSQYKHTSRHATQIIHDPDQYSTDFGKAVHYVREHHRDHDILDIVAIGGLGGRVDQGLSQLHHLYLFQTDPKYSQGRMYLFNGECLTFLLKAGCHRIKVREPGQEDAFGKHVGILPVKEPSVITTKGLEWDVENWETQFGGQVSTSNHVLPHTQVVEVKTTKDVLFTIALRQV